MILFFSCESDPGRSPSRISGCQHVSTVPDGATVRHLDVREVPMLAVGPMSWWRRLGVAAVATGALVMLEPAVAHAEPGVPVPPSEIISDKGAGTLAAADKDLVNKVRLAGLWEIPAGDMAQEKSSNARIKKIGADIAAQHVKLDELARAAAKKLKMDLPDEPNADQKKWLGEMEAANGAEFDQIFIDRLRAAHGKIFPAIGTVRASTRNDTVRKLAQQANQFVATHMTLLESSGKVDFQGLPTAPAPDAATKAPAGSGADPVLSSASQSALTGTPPMLPALLALVAGLAVGGFVMWRVAAGNRRRPAYARRGRR
jgi:putative membrane protein